MGAVVAIDGGEVLVAGSPQPTVVELLERLLEKARVGQIQGISCAWIEPDRLASWENTGLIAPYALVGAVTKAQHALLSIPD